MFCRLKLGPQNSLLSQVFLHNSTRCHFTERGVGEGMFLKHLLLWLLLFSVQFSCPQVEIPLSFKWNPQKIPRTKNHTEFWSLSSAQKGLNEKKNKNKKQTNNKENSTFWLPCGRVCLFIYHTTAINSPRSSSHSYKLPEKILAKILLPTKNLEIVNFKPKKIICTSLSLEIWSTPPPPRFRIKWNWNEVRTGIV